MLGQGQERARATGCITDLSWVMIFTLRGSKVARLRWYQVQTAPLNRLKAELAMNSSH